MQDVIAERALTVALLVAAGLLTVFTFATAPRGPRVALSLAGLSVANGPPASAGAPHEGSASERDPAAAPSVDAPSAESPQVPERTTEPSEDEGSADRAAAALERDVPAADVPAADVAAAPSAATDDAAEAAELDPSAERADDDDAAGSVPAAAEDGPGDEAAWRRRPTREEPCAFTARTVTVARRIRSRQPQDTEGPFEANGEPLFLFLEAHNQSGQRVRGRAHFTHVDSGTRLVGAAEVGVSSRWRTWIDFVVPPGSLGAWTMELVDEERCLVAEHRFEMVPPGWITR